METKGMLPMMSRPTAVAIRLRTAAPVLASGVAGLPVPPGWTLPVVGEAEPVIGQVADLRRDVRRALAACRCAARAGGLRVAGHCASSGNRPGGRRVRLAAR